MQSAATTPEAYIAEMPEERQAAFKKLRSTIKKNLPKGFKEEMSYGMIGYVVPHKLYPPGYHCDPKLPLPFINIASQKNFIAFYHMGLYANKTQLDWFLQEYPKHTTAKLDMGKACIRFKKPDSIPFDLLGQLVTRISVEAWINCYETAVKNNRKK